VKHPRNKKKRVQKSDRATQNKGKANNNLPLMSNTTVIVICVVVPLLLSGFANFFAHKTWILYFPLLGMATLIFYLGHLGIVSLRTPDQPRISAQTESALRGTPKSMESIFWLSSSGKWLSPVSLLCYFRFTNLQPVPMMIESYWVEIMVANKWQRLVNMRTIDGELFNVQNGDFAHAILLDAKSNGFDVIASHRNIAPGETIHGWVFFEIDETFPNQTDARFRMKGVDGVESICRLDFQPVGEQRSLSGGGLIVPPGGQRVNISQLPRVFYSEIKYP
jgi:hypothetical protein